MHSRCWSISIDICELVLALFRRHEEIILLLFPSHLIHLIQNSLRTFCPIPSRLILNQVIRGHLHCVSCMPSFLSRQECSISFPRRLYLVELRIHMLTIDSRRYCMLINDFSPLTISTSQYRTHSRATKFSTIQLPLIVGTESGNHALTKLAVTHPTNDDIRPAKCWVSITPIRSTRYTK